MNTGSTCIIVDDHPAIRMALKATLLNAGVDVMTECDNGDDAFKDILALAPDIVLLDLDLPKMDGLTLLEHLGHHGLPSRIIVLSASDNEHLAARVLAAGAHGYLHKSESLDQLPVAFKLVNSGYSYFSDKAFSLSNLYQSDHKKRTVLTCLSEREFTVVTRLAKGDKNHKIADDLSLSPKTITSYKTRAFEKLGISSLAELIEVLRREGL